MDEQKTSSEKNDQPLSADKSLTWQAQEYLHHEKNVFWYTGLIIITLIIVVILAFLKQWLGVLAVLAMVVALVTYGRKIPRHLTYQLDNKGLTIESKTYPFTHFKSFSVMPDISWHSLDLIPNKRFAPTLTVLLDSAHADTVIEILSAHLPREDHQLDFIDRLARKLKF